MLDFRHISLADRDRINRALKKSDFMGCEYSFANNLAWCRLADSKICFCKDFYIICAFGNDDGIPVFTFPSGDGDYAELFSEMRKFSENSGCPLRVSGVTEKSLKMLGDIFPDEFTAQLDRDGSDYIYKRSSLAELSGRKYHQKRSHLAKFNRLDYEFSLIDERDFDECIYFLTDNYNNKAETDHSAVAEQYAINTYFSYFSELGLVGGIIRTGGKISAVTIGEPLNSDTFCVHIEKADRAVDGIYAGINHCFVRACMDGFEYVNREEDLGIEGLRKAKLSYHPCFLLDKYVLTFK
ncbi:MAG: phosphatidylglycerol lysyltransferase domain-containing protein, partial [Ruminococcus flavefaciens]|nr:phosphatidylglycerol lysyltransferase domain-containing protein [Ruminococcus flavefaciens]MCM1229894.1 phosphatidylglycerol lysyltransferase domain-containing protein [Ruminococcus flavefaciens]